MKAVPAHPLRFVAARDGQQLRHARQVMVKSSVETSHLRQLREAAMKGLCQENLLGQVFGIEGGERAQFRDHFPGDQLRVAVLRVPHAPRDAHRGQGNLPHAGFDPIHERAHGRPSDPARPGAVKSCRPGQAFTPTRPPAVQSARWRRPGCAWSGARASKSANLMLDEPPLTVRMLELTGSIRDRVAGGLSLTPAPLAIVRTGEETDF